MTNIPQAVNNGSGLIGGTKLAAQLGMTGQVTGVRDPLVPTQGPVARFAVLAEDPVGESLARAESWLRAGIFTPCTRRRWRHWNPI